MPPRETDIVTRERLIETVWGEKEISDNNIEVFITFRRNKVDAPGLPKLIRTERGVGYYLREYA
jgi:DNA-binding response OmpR family regulator